MKKNVQIKGTKDGIVVFLDDEASVSEIETELFERLKEQNQATEKEEKLLVKVQLGNRLFSPEEETRITNIINENSQMQISAFYSDVITKKEAREWKEREQVYSMATIVRSGQVLHVPGDFLLIGDVNPGGQIRANGNVFVLGDIKGIIHAGFEGNKQAVIAGKFLYPSQVRIADKFFGFDSEDYKEIEDTELFSAYISEKNEIVIDEIHKIRKIRPEISNFQGGR
ncbi:septum site-determining protein MinC [Listeria sp. PSOL-1]|uniref:septum site-determining protein MinC n=1 Tax=Listeria sp. PSOL-1 TaxID=1844999 RepID=UPI0013D6E5A9|nr:septum site-determining protein MinC [Listeria sp. PSOL-1]